MTDRAVLLSIKPKYCELIASGKKTVEVRKTRPKIPTPFKGYIYCTKGETVYLPRDIFGNEALNGKVIGEFVCNEITKIINGGSCFTIENCAASETNQVARSSCLDFDGMKKYLSKKDGYAWHISDLKIYNKPKELSDFKKYTRTCYYSDLGFAIPKCSDCRDCNLKRPPQSWCYVEEMR